MLPHSPKVQKGWRLLRLIGSNKETVDRSSQIGVSAGQWQTGGATLALSLLGEERRSKSEKQQSPANLHLRLDRRRGRSGGSFHLLSFSSPAEESCSSGSDRSGFFRLSFDGKNMGGRGNETSISRLIIDENRLEREQGGYKSREGCRKKANSGVFIHFLLRSAAKRKRVRKVYRKSNHQQTRVVMRSLIEQRGRKSNERGGINNLIDGRREAAKQRAQGGV